MPIVTIVVSGSLPREAAAPIVEARITVRKGQNIVHQAATDENGQCKIELEKGQYRVSATAFRESAEKRDVDVPEES